MSNNKEADIAQRARFYNEPDVVREISKNGVPKTRKAMDAMISAGSAGKSASGVTQEARRLSGFRCVCGSSATDQRKGQCQWKDNCRNHKVDRCTLFVQISSSSIGNVCQNR